MNQEFNDFEKECEAIRHERNTYILPNRGAQKFLTVLSAVFFFAGFIALILIYFTNVTLLQATCLFVISYIIEPTDGDRYESMAKGIAEDLGNIRASLAVMRKNSEEKKK